MGRKKENTGFTCGNCGKPVVPVTNGSFRNHCPFCLCSKHLDIEPGDRAAECGGLMRPSGLEHSSGKGWQIVFRCGRCGHVSKNKVAEGTVMPDDLTELLERMSRRGFSG